MRSSSTPTAVKNLCVQLLSYPLRTNLCFRVSCFVFLFSSQHSRALASPLPVPHLTLRLSHRGLRALLDCDKLSHDGAVPGRLCPRTAPAAVNQRRAGRAPGMLLTPLPVSLWEASNRRQTPTRHQPWFLVVKSGPIVDRFAETVTNSVARRCYAIPCGSGKARLHSSGRLLKSVF